jgi:hypothetical protein
MPRSARVLSLSQRRPGHTTSIGENGVSHQRWQPRFQPKMLGMNLTRFYGTIPDSSVVDEAVRRRLARQGDARDLDDIPDIIYNEMFLDAFPQVMNDEEPDHESIEPQIYNPQSSSWEPHSSQGTAFKKGVVLKIASWKLFPPTSYLAAIRASAAIAHLRDVFGKKPHNLVVMLQEIREESLDAILRHEWVQQNFIISDTEPPYHEFDLDEEEESDLESSQCFSIMMISRNLPISNCSRVSFFSETNCDALVVDVPVSESEGPGPQVSKQSLRLCTTRLEPHYEDPDRRRSQLVTVSEILKGKWSQGQKILGGLVGGNMGPLAAAEKHMHQDPEIGLMDIWEDRPAPVPPAAKPSKKNTRSEARADAWIFHPDRKRKERKLDKFLYTGPIETVTFDEARKKTTFGGELKTKVEEEVLETKIGSKKVRVSQHEGITVNIKVV